MLCCITISVFMSLTYQMEYISGSTFDRLDEKVKCHMAERAKVLKQDSLHRTGQNIVLNRKEILANNVLLKVKKSELDEAVLRGYSLPSRMYTKVKTEIENSNIFKMLRKMPKGALLHTHDFAMATYDWLITNVTYRETCFTCYNHYSKITMFKLARHLPDCTEDCKWISCRKARQLSLDREKFDADLYRNWTLMNQDTEKLYLSQDKLWHKFSSVFISVEGLLRNKELFKEYYWHALEELVEDNIQYVEVRALLIPLYDLDGNTFSSPEVVLQIYEDVTRNFVAKHSSHFHGARIIYTCHRFESKSVIEECIDTAVTLQDKYPAMMAGFDLVGQEDSGAPLRYFLEQLLLPSAMGKRLHYFFHAGETNWVGQHVDNNLIDAYLLNTSRVGHGFALTKHPELMKLYRARNIAADVCPISNQVLGLVSDLRQHPAAVFLSQDFPITVSNDDPGIWGTKGVSHDWYELFMGMTRPEDGLALLKQLAINSIRFSSLDRARKDSLMHTFERKWDKFIDDILEQSF